MRIGWFSNWCDSWYSEFVYYPEFLHEIYRIRLYLYYFFSLTSMEKLSLILNKFEIFVKSNFLIVRIYIYDSNLIEKISFFHSQVSRIVFRMKRRKIIYSFSSFFRRRRWEKKKLRKRFFSLRTFFKRKSHFFVLFFSFFFSVTNAFCLKIMRNYFIGKSRLKFYSLSKKFMDFLLSKKDKTLIPWKEKKPLKWRWAANYYKRIMRRNRLRWEALFIFRTKLLSYIFALIGRLRKKYLNVFFFFFKVNFLLNNRIRFFSFYKIFCIFLLMFRNFFYNSSRSGALLKNASSFFFENFTTFSLFVSFFYFFRYRIVKFFFSSIVKILVPFLNLRLDVLLASNDNVTAYFLSWYICKRLSQNYGVREIMNPILKEMKILAISTRTLRKSMAFEKYGINLNLRYRSSIVKSFVYKFFSIYKRFFLRFFYLNHTLFNSYLIWFLLWFFDKFSNFHKLLIGFSKNFFLKRQAFLLFFNYDLFYIKNHLEFVFNEVFFDFFLNSQDSIFFFVLFDDLFSTFNIIFNNRFRIFFEPKGFFAVNVLYNRLIKFNYWKYNYKWLINFNNLNKSKLRSERHFLKSGLLGFKIHFRGRFSRKQRAAYLTFREGLLPLNTLSADIDYSFNSVPLQNSLVSVKVWLYKTTNFQKWYIRLI